MPLLNSPQGGGANNSSQKGFGSFTGFGGADLSTSEGLLELAKMKGGAVGAAAEELAHPQTGILSTIGEKFKNGFREFVDIISTPNQIVAGIISKDLTVGEAIRDNISTSDVIFGDRDPNATTLQKVGGFVVRTATDILLDPLTYLTFGGARGILGLSSLQKVTLGEKAAAQVGKNALDTAFLSETGTELYQWLTKIEKVKNGTMSFEKATADVATLSKTFAGGVDEAFDMGKNELDELLKETLDSKLRPDFAKKAISNLLETKPALADTILDKGGIKFFGKSILDSQRISAVSSLVPGMTLLDQTTKPIRMAVGALFDPAIIKTDEGFKRLPEEYVQLMQQAKDLAVSLGDDRILKLENIVEKNKLTTQESKFLTASLEGGRIPADNRLAQAYRELLGFNDAEFEFLRKSGIAISRKELHMPHVLLRTKVGNISVRTPVSVKAGAAMQRTIDMPIFAASKEGSEASIVLAEKALKEGNDEKFNSIMNELRNVGMEIFDDNIITAHARRTLENIRTGVSSQFVSSLMEDAAGFYAISAKEATAAGGQFSKWVPVSSSAIQKGANDLLQILGENNDQLVFHPAVAKSLEEFAGSVINDDATNNFLKAYDKIQNLWKAGVTSIFPAFHGRNAISNVFQNFLDIGYHAINPSTQYMSMQIVRNDRVAMKLEAAMAAGGEEGAKAADELYDLLNKKVFTDVTENKWTYGELRQVMKERGIAFSRNITGPIDIREGLDDFGKNLFPDSHSTGDRVKRVAKKVLPISQEFKPFEIGRNIGTLIEEQARVTNFVTNLRATGDVMHAAQRTKQFLFDYSNLTRFEKEFLRRVIPFYTFTRKNLELQAKTLAATPGRIAAELTTIGNIGEAMSGQQLTEEERAALPDWIKTGMGILASKKGSTVTILQGLGTPIEQPFQALQPNVLLGSVSPLLRVPVEQMSGYSFFQGKLLSDVTNAAAYRSAPGALKDFIGYTEIKGKKTDGAPFTWYVSLRPERMNIINNLPLAGRVLSSIKQMEAQDVSTQYKTLQQLVGVRPYSFDIEREADKREKEMMGKLENLLTKAGVTAQFKRTFIPKDKKGFQ
jgi:hypothetical protein